MSLGSPATGLSFRRFSLSFTELLRRQAVGLALLLFASGLSVSQSIVQSAGWVWMGGSSLIYSPGVYGTLGSPAPGNMPGSRAEANRWIDNDGNLWVYGGYGTDSTTSLGGELNDLWEFNPGTREWRWMNGSATLPTCSNYPNCGFQPVYGTLKVFAPQNQPGSRSGAATWTDKAGNLWLFGGLGVPYPEGGGPLFNDLWEFDPAKREWAWMAGCQLHSGCSEYGVYGTLRVPAAGNFPGPRGGAASWADSKGNFWLFGGGGDASAGTGGGALNDLWEFNPSTMEWTWIGGSSTGNTNGATIPGDYGALGVPLPSNLPPGRSAAYYWIDPGDNLWIFGGQIPYRTVSGPNSGEANDLWKFDTTALEWTWMSGSSSLNESGSYGKLGTPDAANVPGARSASTGWIDQEGNLWLFGGIGLTSGNDLWSFSTSSNEWTWMGGATQTSDQPGVYGTIGLANPLNAPGSRSNPSGWMDKNGVAWLYGGFGEDSNDSSGVLNDLWAYGVQASSPQFSLQPGTYTATQTVTLSDPSSGAAIYYTTDGSIPTVNSTSYSGAIPVNVTTTITANAVGPGFVVSPPAVATYTINLAKPVITWPAPSPITYGTALSAAQLDATANTPGIFAYSPAAGVVLSGGTQSLSATFGPTDTVHYASGTATVLLTVNPAPQTVSFTQLPAAATYGTAPIALSATASSQLPVSFSVLSGPAYVLNSNSLAITGAGTVVVAANQPGNSNYLAAPQITQSLAIKQDSQSIGFAAPGTLTYGTPPVGLVATASSGLPVAFSVASGPATISGSVFTVTGAGSVTIAANQAGNVNYLAAAQVTRTVVVAKASQKISFPTPSPVTYGTAPITLHAKASSGLPVFFRVLSGPASVSGAALTITGAGTVELAADQAGNGNYLPAPEVRQAVLVKRAAQVISFPSIGAVQFGIAPIQLRARASSGLPVSFSVVSGPGLINRSTLTITGAGSILIGANQLGSVNYLAAAEVNQTLTVKQAPQSISFTPPRSVTFGLSPFRLSASASSGLPVKLSLLSGPASLIGSMLTIKGAGTVVIAANQLGGGNYLHAPELSRTISVEKAKLAVTATSFTIKQGQPVPKLAYSIKGFVDGDTLNSSTTGQPKLTTTATSTSPPGTYTIKIVENTLAARNYTFKFVNGTLTIEP